MSRLRPDAAKRLDELELPGFESASGDAAKAVTIAIDGLGAGESVEGPVVLVFTPLGIFQLDMEDVESIAAIASAIRRHDA